MPRAGVVDKIVIYQRQGVWYETYRGKYANDGGSGFLFTRKLDNTQVMQQKTKTQVKSQKNQVVQNAKKSAFTSMRVVKNVAFHGVGGLMGYNFGVGLAIANRVTSGIRGIANVAGDIYSSATGETTEANNMKSFVNYITNPSKMIIEGTYGNWLRNMGVTRANTALAYHRDLTGQIVNTKDKGNYK